MASQFVSAFLIIGLLVFLGVVMTIGVINAKMKQVSVSPQSNDTTKPGQHLLE